MSCGRWCRGSWAAASTRTSSSCCSCAGRRTSSPGERPVADAGLGHERAGEGAHGRLVPYAVVDTETHTFVRAWPAETSPQVSPVDPFTRADHSGDLLVAEMDRIGVDVAIV